MCNDILQPSYLTHVATPFFFQVFHDVLLDLRRVVSSAYILNDNICDPFFVLSELCEYRVDGGNHRPICYLVGGCMYTHIVYM